MADTAEKEKVIDATELSVEEIPQTPEIPPEIERAGVTTTQSQFTAQVSDDQGQPLIQNSQSNVTITLPADHDRLTKLSKGSVSDAITWMSAYFLRMIKKAIHFGWKVVVKN